MSMRRRLQQVIIERNDPIPWIAHESELEEVVVRAARQIPLNHCGRVMLAENSATRGHKCSHPQPQSAGHTVDPFGIRIVGIWPQGILDACAGALAHVYEKELMAIGNLHVTFDRARAPRHVGDAARLSENRSITTPSRSRSVMRALPPGLCSAKCAQRSTDRAHASEFQDRTCRPECLTERFRTGRIQPPFAAAFDRPRGT